MPFTEIHRVCAGMVHWLKGKVMFRFLLVLERSYLKAARRFILKHFEQVGYCILRGRAGILYIVSGWKEDKASQSEPGHSRMSAKHPLPPLPCQKHPPSHPTHASAFSKQDHYEDTMQWKYVCRGQAGAAKCWQRTKAKCASHSLTQKLLSPRHGWD